jgi:hypothetical protein
MQMQIGDDTNLVAKFWRRLNHMGRSFVRNHSDLAMTHVVAYYKGYQKAARDVATLIDDSGKKFSVLMFRDYVLRIAKYDIYVLCAGVEPILHDDITTHMCSCIGGSITGVIVIITGNLLLHQRKNYDDVDDVAVVENMLVAFILSYTLIFTVMEPLRASIKAVYVSFAQSPRSISQAFPLIFHRLCRLSESNLT